MTAKRNPSAVLIHPPLTDPTAPYHSAVYVASHARANGFRVRVLDANIEAPHYCSHTDVMTSLLSKWTARRHELSQRSSLSRFEQLEYKELVRTEVLRPDAAASAIQTLQDATSFYDYAQYRRATKDLQLWLRALAIEGFPGQFQKDFTLSKTNLFNLNSAEDLSDKMTIDRIAAPFSPYFENILFEELRSFQPDVVGLSVTYTSQLPFAVWLLHQLRRVLPDAYLVCGGTEIAAVWKYSKASRAFGRIFSCADACVIGEGESAFLSILNSIARGERASRGPNIVSVQEDGAYDLHTEIQYEDMNEVARPDYSLLDHSRYFSPFAMVYYSPTRGCYWNKCTFCDYGLNFNSPTSPWRSRNLNAVLADLTSIAQHTKYIYLSVDVLAPAAIVKLARAIISAGLKIRWAAEIRLERYFDRESCELLQKSGCVAVSVGFESACQRILDQIQKGTAPHQIEEVIRNFSNAGIAIQMMGFTGFPGETFPEAMETVDFLNRTRSHWTVAALGEFVLTPGAIVAQNPAEFGLDAVGAPQGDDVARWLIGFEKEGSSKSVEERDALEAAKRTLQTAEFDRPFAGGIDTAHSIFYYDKYGSQFPSKVRESADTLVRTGNEVVRICGKLLNERYSVLSMFGLDELRRLRYNVTFGKTPWCDTQAIRIQISSRDHEVCRESDLVQVFVREDGLILPVFDEALSILCEVDGEQDWATIKKKLSAKYPSAAEVCDLMATVIASSGIIARVDAPPVE